MITLPDPPNGCRWTISPFADKSLKLKLKRGLRTLQSELILTDRLKNEDDFRREVRKEAEDILSRHARAHPMIWARRMLRGETKENK